MKFMKAPKDHLRSYLLSTLRTGDLVVMDSLPSHKLRGVSEIIEQAAAITFYLPPYHPDLRDTLNIPSHHGPRNTRVSGKRRGDSTAFSSETMDVSQTSAGKTVRLRNGEPLEEKKRFLRHRHQ